MGDDASVAQSLVNWVNTFPVSASATTLYDLDDGVVLFEVLSQIVPHICTNVVIKRDTGENYLLKVGNIKKIVSCLEDFYSHELGIVDPVLALVNPTAIAKAREGRTPEGDEEIARLVELVLGAAVSCENKNSFIENIVLLDETSQHDLMIIIDRVIKRHQMSQASPKIRGGAAAFAHSSVAASSAHDDNDMELIRLRKERDEANTSLHELSLEQSSLTAENAQLRQEKEALVEMMKSMEDQLAERERQFEIEKKRDKESRAEESLLINMAKHTRELNEEHTQQLQMEIDEKSKEISELKKKLEDSSKAQAELRKLRDTLDIMKEKVASAQKTEEKFNRLQNKLEEVADLKLQYKNMQEQSEAYMKKALQFEEDAARVPVLTRQLETYQKEVSSLKAHALSGGPELQMQVQRLEEENKKLKEENDLRHDKISTLEDHIQKLTSDLESASQPGESLGNLGVGETFSSFTEVLTPEIKEKMMRLELENEKLKQSQAAAPVAVAATSSEGDEEKEVRIRQEVERKVREELEAEYKEREQKERGEREAREKQESEKRKAEQERADKERQEARDKEDKERQEARDQQDKEKEEARNNEDKEKAARDKQDRERIVGERAQMEEELHKQIKRVQELQEETDKQTEEIKTLRVAVEEAKTKQVAEPTGEKEAEKEKADGEGAGGGEESAELLRKLQLIEERNQILVADKNRLEGYLRTAKTMIRELRQNKSADSSDPAVRKQYEDTIALLQHQLEEKKEESAIQKNILRESKEGADREQRLMMSAIYDIGLRIARSQAPRLELEKQAPASFLATLRNTIAK